MANVVDAPINAKIETFGDIKTLYNRDAISNSIRLWLVSKKFEIPRQPNLGGYVYPLLEAPMTDDNAQALRDFIRSGLTQGFTPRIRVNFVDVKVDYTRKLWDIYINVTSFITNEVIDIKQKIKKIG